MRSHFCLPNWQTKQTKIINTEHCQEYGEINSMWTFGVNIYCYNLSRRKFSSTCQNCDLDIELVGSNQNGGFLSGRLRANTNLNIKDVVIRNAILPEKTGLICGGGDNNATNSTVTVENIYVMNTNAKLLQSCATKVATNPVTTFSITYTNSFMDAASLANVTDNETTYFQSVDKANTNVRCIIT